MSGDNCLHCKPGLSPRVRGNRTRDDAPSYPVGSIPACAGEPVTSVRIRLSPWVYPRVCGGTSPRNARRTLSVGLSPRVRGNRRPKEPHGSTPGSIPACAGEPDLPIRSASSFKVYPRVCGGTPGRTHAEVMQAGSIPACAGEPDGGRVELQRARVYLRVCGGTCRTANRIDLAKGLSPRVRGNHLGIDDATAVWGSIPACAGEPQATPGVH